MKHCDIICIGLGISGLYFGYKALKSNKKILFIEKEERVGGRIKSVSLGNNPYWAEGCATRFFYNPNSPPSLQNDGYVVQLLEELNIGSTPMPNDRIETGDYYLKVIQKINQMYPVMYDSLAKLSFPTQVELLGYSIKEFADQIGYPLFEDPINLNMAMRTLNKFVDLVQNFVDGGYENVCEKIYHIIKKRFKFKFNKTVSQIDYIDNCYIINNKYKAKKLLFTGTIDQLNTITINIPHLLELKRNLVNSYFDYRAIRIYLKIKDPWWTKDDILKKWNTGTALNQIIYFTKDTIQIYSNMWASELLFYMIPEKFRTINKFIDSSNVPQLVNYVSQKISEIIGVQNIKIDKIWYKYTRAAAQFVRPIEENYNKFIKRIQENNNFYMLSGDYTLNPGWVNSCLQIVEEKYKNIICD
ncbi:NADP-binding rossmann-like domain protein [Catovirus CTV1]|uniref:NADP-binding rossmann-like domain protein n=1 Tax=Catovirus CTV1 TaxID=1977631 RepID=A0A1V0S931_9VIRU|nr:NADP-binding rossmann-like domain protein [Catovirus CTV1]